MTATEAFLKIEKHIGSDPKGELTLEELATLYSQRLGTAKGIIFRLLLRVPVETLENFVSHL